MNCFFKIKQLNRILFFLFILLLPTQLGKHFFFPFSYLSGVRVDYLAPTLYLTDIVVLLLLIFNYQFILNFLKNKKIFIIFGLLLVNIIFSQSPPISMYRYIKFLEFFIIVILVFSVNLKPKIILLGFLITGFIELSLSIFQLKLGQSIQGVFYFLGERSFSLSTPGIAKAVFNGIEFLRPYATFSHPNSMAGFYLLLYFYFLTNKKLNRYIILKYFSLTVFSFLIFISFSKLTILVFLILNTLYFIGNTKSCRLCLITKIIIFIIVGLLFFQIQTDPQTLQKRLELIKNSLLIISRYPILGVGLGNYLIAQNQFISHYPVFFNQPVHNIFLLFITETGLIFGGVFFLLFFETIKKLIKIAPFVFLVILITGFFDHYWLTLQQNFLLLGFIIGKVFMEKEVKKSKNLLK